MAFISRLIRSPALINVGKAGVCSFTLAHGCNFILNSIGPNSKPHRSNLDPLIHISIRSALVAASMFLIARKSPVAGFVSSLATHGYVLLNHISEEQARLDKEYRRQNEYSTFRKALFENENLAQTISKIQHLDGINIRDDDGDTVLYELSHPQLETIESLCQKGADPTLLNKRGWNAIQHQSSWRNKGWESVCDALAKGISDPEKRKTAVDWAYQATSLTTLSHIWEFGGISTFQVDGKGIKYNLEGD